MGVKFTGKDLDLLNSSINDLFSDDFLDTVDGSSPETVTNDESSIMDELNDIANGKQPVTLQPIDDDDEVIIVPSDESDTELVESHNEQTSIEEEIDEMLNPKTDAPKQKTANKSKKKPTVKETADERQEEETHIEPVLDEEEQEEQIQEVQQYDELTDRLEGLTIPQWAEGLYSKLKASVAHSFMLSGNVRDYFTGHISIEDGLALLVSRRLRFAVFAEYDQAHGLTFDLAKRTYGDDPMAVKQRFISMLDAARANLHMPPSEGTIPQDVTELFTCLAEIYEMPPIDGYDANICLIVDYADLLIPDSRGQQMRDADKRLQIVIADLCRSTKADEGCSCLVMLTDNPDGVSSYIRDTASRTDQIAIPHPTLETRREFINGVLDRDDYTLDDGRQIFSCEDGVSCEYLAANTAGLACYQIEDIVLRALADNTPITPQVVKDRKNEIIKNDYNDVIEIMDPRGGFETIGGLDRVKRFFTEEVIEPIHEQKLEAVPMGVLLMGPPGSAKTALSRAVAYEAGMNCVELNMNHIMDKYVGQSERNLDRALDCAMAMQPTIIFIDEIDEALPKRHMGEISSVNSRINKRLLQFFSETKHRGQVMILAATNFPDKIDAAFKRAGRFDKRIPMFAPDDFDRIRIIRIMAARAATVNGTFGDSRPYSVSCLADPDTMVSNPFRELRRWMDDGNVPITSRFFGEKVEYHAVHQDKYGQTVEEITYLPNLLLDIVDKRRIPLWQLYRGCDILLGDRMPIRKDDTASMSVEDDKTFYRRITDAIYASQDIFGTNQKNLDRVSQWLQYRDKYYAPFASQTFRMTGAELEVVMSKAITLFRRWQKDNPDAYAKMVAQGHERDIPWSVLLEASTKMTASMASVKAMEDAALKDTSDTDHIPDALYGRTKDGADISYRQRYEELRLMDERVD